MFPLRQVSSRRLTWGTFTKASRFRSAGPWGTDEHTRSHSGGPGTADAIKSLGRLPSRCGSSPEQSRRGPRRGFHFLSHFTTAVWTPFLSKFQASRDIQRRHSSVAQKLPYNIQPQLKECRPETTMRVFITARTASSHHECLELTYKPNINLCLPNAFVTVGYSVLHRFPVRKTRRNGFSHWPEDCTGPAPGAWGQHQHLLLIRVSSPPPRIVHTPPRGFQINGNKSPD